MYLYSRLTSQPGATLPNGHSSLCEYSDGKLDNIEIVIVALG